MLKDNLMNENTHLLTDHYANESSMMPDDVLHEIMAHIKPEQNSQYAIEAGFVARQNEYVVMMLDVDGDAILYKEFEVDELHDAQIFLATLYDGMKKEYDPTDLEPDGKVVEKIDALSNGFDSMENICKEMNFLSYVGELGNLREEMFQYISKMNPVEYNAYMNS